MLMFAKCTVEGLIPSACDLCATADVRDEQHVLFYCTHPCATSIRRKHAFLFSQPASRDVLTKPGQQQTSLFLHELHEQASSHTP